MPKQHTERAFEEAIEHHLINYGGYKEGDRAQFNREKCLDTAILLSFIKKTQPKKWEYLNRILGEKAESQLVKDLMRALDSDHEGCLHVLRHGFKCYGKLFYVAFFKPASNLNPETQALYEANELTITRQLHYSLRHEKSLDVVLSLNGIPIVTAELKNPMSGQTWRDAEHQYKNDRDPADLMFQFKKRTLVHFAVDTDQVHMTTELKQDRTVFLPFNKGHGYGAGNPENPEGYKTAYLWEEILPRDSFMDILHRFMHLEIEEKRAGGKKVRTEKMIFPRYHQLDAVLKLEHDCQEKGSGENYLVQHSTGSGKSNTIAWLAHRMTSLHDENDEKVFDSVVVVTDRLVLDQQLQDAIYQFEHKQGVVEKIEEDSTQLAEALQKSVPIIVTTLQKFPFVTEKIESLPKRDYAVIIDEAHSSQGGETATEMKEVLAGSHIEEQIAEQQEEVQPDYQEQVLKTMAARGKQPNISFFAFTGTPKHKTLEVFGHPGPDGKPSAFHLYSMRQAIEEGFIMDVLQNYTTYKTFYKLAKSVEDDPHVEKRKAARALARFVSLHPHNIAQKTEVIIEHFRHFTMHKIGGKAKAMVVTPSRLHAVRYKRAFDEYLKENGYGDIKALVAFSGNVVDPEFPDVEYTEEKMNLGIREHELREAFASDEYQLLLVAEKYQTGFDQPLLHTMYVDKKLSGLHAVQTLSRLNRPHPGKEDTFVLDFVNDAEDIREAFQDYYECTMMADQADPNQLYELQARLANEQVYYQAEVEEFAKIFYKPKEKQTKSDHAKINACIDPAVNRFRELDEEDQEEFRHLLSSYRNLYAYLAQVIPFQDSDLEKLYSYIRFLLSKLPKRSTGSTYRFDDEVSLQYYRLQKISEGTIELEKNQPGEISGPTSVGTGGSHEEQVELSRLIDLLNDRFGTDFTPADQLFFDSIKEDAVSDSNLREAALANSEENFSYVFYKALESLFIDRMEQNQELTAKFLNEDEFRRTVSRKLLEEVYRQIHQEKAQEGTE